MRSRDFFLGLFVLIRKVHFAKRHPFTCGCGGHQDLVYLCK